MRSGTAGGGEEAAKRPSGEERKSRAGQRRQGGEGVACKEVGFRGGGGVSTRQDAPAQLLCF